MAIYKSIRTPLNCFSLPLSQPQNDHSELDLLAGAGWVDGALVGVSCFAAGDREGGAAAPGGAVIGLVPGGWVRSAAGGCAGRGGGAEDGGVRRGGGAEVEVVCAGWLS